MRLWPRSLFGRLLGVSVVTTLAALAFAGVTIGHVLERFVIRGLDQQLDAQIFVLAQAVSPAGRLDPARAVSLPAFAAPASGWGWRVDGPAGHWRGGADIGLPSGDPAPPRRGGRHGRPPDPDAPRPGDARDATGEPIHFRQLSVATLAGPVLVTASGPRRVALVPLREAMVPLLLSLALLGGALALATLLQLRFGLRPLGRLRRDLGEVRAGRMRHVPVDQPAEVAPLAAELNALIDQNEAGLAYARRHVSNLAHGLKTPLAALALKLAEGDSDPDGSLRAAVAQIDRRVRHHLGRARAAMPGAGRRARTPLAPAIADLADALRRIHADRPVAAVIDIAPGLATAVDPQDLDEMAGNLLDNAWRHARSAIRVEGRAVNGSVALTIDDDGPGLSEAAVAEALLPGRRLDERGDGHGFGLPIARELAELNGGTLALGAAPALGGLRAVLTLPGAATPS